MYEGVGYGLPFLGGVDQASPLYGLVEDYFDEFEHVYDDRFALKHGFWRRVVRKIV